MSRIAGTLLVLIAVATALPARAADAPLKEDRIKFIVHDLVAAQISASDLGGYLETLNDLLQRSQGTSIDFPTCTDIGTLTSGGPAPELFTSSGGLSNDLAIIDTEQELLDVLAWGATQGGRVGIFVQDIQWCGAVAPNTLGCAPAPGTVFVVSLTASASLRPMVIGHERGHNASLLHRTDDTCAMMAPSAASHHGCLNQSEAKAFWDQADITTGDTCECIDPVQTGPFQTWSLNPQGTVCDDDDACTTTSSCNVGLCVGGMQLDCDDANPCTGEACDPVGGCSNPAVSDGTSCDDSTVCNGSETCFSGTCTAGTPMNCDDLAYCNGNESCDSLAGCQSGTPPPTDDGVDCTDDSCDEVGDVVVHTPNPLLCDDGDACTAESCDELTGCSNDPIPECVPGVPASSPAGRAILLGLIVGAAAIGTRLLRRSGSSGPAAARPA